MMYICPKCKKSDRVEPFNFKHIKLGKYVDLETGDIFTAEDSEEIEQKLYLMCKRCCVFGKIDQFIEK